MISFGGLFENYKKKPTYLAGICHVCVCTSMHLFESCPFLSWLVLLLVGHVNVMNIIMLFSKNQIHVKVVPTNVVCFELLFYFIHII